MRSEGLSQFVGEDAVWLSGDNVGIKHQFLALLGNGVHDGGRAVSGETDGVTAIKVEILFSHRVPDVGALSFGEGDGELVVGIE